VIKFDFGGVFISEKGKGAGSSFLLFSKSQ
jgi:hypothetical protein